ncbi:polyketide antibiotic transporter [Kocuria sp. CPCC 205292]|uniref:ABC transporter permease n=1 Tax=Kocuria cellulosilytica TaxID=3071451 RepID=UPI0034D7025B
MRTAEPWAATGRLFRLYLRLDRVRILVWVLALTGTVYATVLALEETFPDGETRQARAALLDNPSAVMMTGPAFGADDYTLGAMTVNELSLSVLVATAIMSILLASRHVRAEEESGRLEVVRALPVGRFAPAAAALGAVAVADAAVGAGITAGLFAAGLGGADAVAWGLATALTGLVFGSVAAVTAQLTEHARAASGAAMAVLGAAFLVRGIGDVIEPTGSWLSWFSPVAWAQQTRLYVDLRWWPLALSAALTGVLLGAAVLLAQRRDLGAGLRRGRPGPATAAASLLSATGLARRLLRGTFLGWAAGLVLFGLAFGSLADSLEDSIADIPSITEWLVVDLDALTESFAAAMLSYLALGVVAFAVSAVLRLRAEEESGRTALILSTGLPRARWALGWLAVVVVQALLALLLAGAALGAGVTATTGDLRWTGELALAALAYFPAVLVTAGLTAALVGLAPRAAALSWAVVAHIVFVAWFGLLLDLPGWAMDLSPVQLTPLVPSEDWAAAPLLGLAALGAALLAAAAVGFHRRDLLA